MQRMDYINAFWVGGLICALVQILMEKTKMTHHGASGGHRCGHQCPWLV